VIRGTAKSPFLSEGHPPPRDSASRMGDIEVSAAMRRVRVRFDGDRLGHEVGTGGRTGDGVGLSCTSCDRKTAAPRFRVAIGGMAVPLGYRMAPERNARPIGSGALSDIRHVRRMPGQPCRCGESPSDKRHRAEIRRATMARSRILRKIIVIRLLRTRNFAA